MGNKHLANVLSGHLQMKPVPMQYGASKDNETACKKVGSYVFQSALAMTRSLAHSLNRNNEWHVNETGRLTLFFSLFQTELELYTNNSMRIKGGGLFTFQSLCCIFRRGGNIQRSPRRDSSPRALIFYSVWWHLQYILAAVYVSSLIFQFMSQEDGCVLISFCSVVYCML